MQILRDYIMRHVGLPYRWGGDDPVLGYDCSGFVQECLASVGLDPPGDQTAQALFNHFEQTAEWNRAGCGTLLFFGESVTKITHVGIMVDAYRYAEAGGGGSKTTSLEAAAAQNAFLRLRHKSYRKDMVAMIRPRYVTIGII